MNHLRQPTSPLGVFKSGISLGGKVGQYRDKQKIYSQGDPASTLFYIQHGGVRLSTRSKGQASAVTAILGVHDFFGEACLAGYPLRMSTAVAMSASSIRTIQKGKMLQLLRKRNKASNALVGYLLASLKKYRELQDDVGIGYVLTGFASLAVEQKQPARAARLYAAGLAILDRFSIVFDPDDQLDIDHYSAKLLTLLSPDAFKAASAEGRTTSSERAIALALGAR